MSFFLCCGVSAFVRATFVTLQYFNPASAFLGIASIPGLLCRPPSCSYRSRTVPCLDVAQPGPLPLLWWFVVVVVVSVPARKEGLLQMGSAVRLYSSSSALALLVQSGG
jgi:hypothetical protein